jgi:hypothetical protein
MEKTSSAKGGLLDGHLGNCRRSWRGVAIPALR